MHEDNECSRCGNGSDPRDVCDICEFVANDNKMYTIKKEIVNIAMNIPELVAVLRKCPPTDHTLRQIAKAEEALRYGTTLLINL